MRHSAFEFSYTDAELFVLNGDFAAAAITGQL